MDEEVTRGFVPCDVCGIGLGKFEYFDEDKQKWLKVKGEIPYKWTGKEITMRYLDFPDNLEETLEWVVEKITPENVCEECLEKYK